MAIYLKLFKNSTEYESSKNSIIRPSVSVISGDTSCRYSSSSVKVQTTGFTYNANALSSEASELKITPAKDNTLYGVSLAINGTEFSATEDSNTGWFSGKVPVASDSKLSVSGLQLSSDAKNEKEVTLYYGYGSSLVPIEVYDILGITVNDYESLISSLSSNSASTLISTVLSETGIQLYANSLSEQTIIVTEPVSYGIPIAVGSTFSKPLTFQLPTGVNEVAVLTGGNVTLIE